MEENKNALTDEQKLIDPEAGPGDIPEEAKNGGNDK